MWQTKKKIKEERNQLMDRYAKLETRFYKSELNFELLKVQHEMIIIEFGLVKEKAIQVNNDLAQSKQYQEGMAFDILNLERNIDRAREILKETCAATLQDKEKIQNTIEVLSNEKDFRALL